MASSTIQLQVWTSESIHHGFLMDGQGLVEFAYGRRSSGLHYGDIAIGRVIQADPRLQGSFIDCGNGGYAFLPDEPDSPKIHPGAPVLAQVMREASGGKLPRLTRRYRLPGFFMVYGRDGTGMAFSRRFQDGQADAKPSLTAWGERHVSPGETLIWRCAAASILAMAPDSLDLELLQLRARFDSLLRQLADGQIGIIHRHDQCLRLIQENADSLTRIDCDSRRSAEKLTDECNLWPGLQERIYVMNPKEKAENADTLNEELRAALDPEITLPSGGAIYFEPARRVNVIDVDMRTPSGGGGQSGAASARLTNEEAARVAARQVRLRNIAGLIVIDFIDMKGLDAARKLRHVLRQSFLDDPAPVRLGQGMEFGLQALTRQRRGPALRDIIDVAQPDPLNVLLQA